MKRQEQKQDNVIEIIEEVRVPGTNVILEEGDRIEVLKERFQPTKLTDSFLMVLENNVPGYGVDPDPAILVDAFEQILGYMENDLEELGLDFDYTIR